MKKNSLTVNNGLSLSQAQSISNLCNQRAKEIEQKLSGVNNYKKSVRVVQGSISKNYDTVAGKPLPENVVALLIEKSKLHACQAFLMENIKAKEVLLQEIKAIKADTRAAIEPERVVSKRAGMYPVVDEIFGWSQLTTAELNEYLEAEAYAAHIGQFIHKDGLLDNLRNELPKIPAIEWMNIKDGEKTPVDIVIHNTHTPENLLKVHEELAALHRQHEQRVNYFKAKVKNITTEENARIARLNADEQSNTQKFNNDEQQKYQTAMVAYNEQVRSIQAEFEKERQAKTAEIAKMRINIDLRFQDTINMFLGKLSDKQE